MADEYVTGKKYRILKDATNDTWNVVSFWTSSADVFVPTTSGTENLNVTLSKKANVANPTFTGNMSISGIGVVPDVTSGSETLTIGADIIDSAGNKTSDIAKKLDIENPTVTGTLTTSMIRVPDGGLIVDGTGADNVTSVAGDLNVTGGFFLQNFDLNILFQGTAGQVLVSDGTNGVKWVDASTI